MDLNARSSMRKRTTDRYKPIFPVTVDDWREARHEEDPADSRIKTDDIGRVPDPPDLLLESNLTVRHIYRR